MDNKEMLEDIRHLLWELEKLTMSGKQIDPSGYRVGRISFIEAKLTWEKLNEKYHRPNDYGYNHTYKHQTT